MLPVRHTHFTVQVCTILSQNTTDVNSARAFAKLKEKFPEWEMVRTADNGMPLLPLLRGILLACLQFMFIIRIPATINSLAFDYAILASGTAVVLSSWPSAPSNSVTV